ncbi:RNA polymerase sigma factor [Membranihabitans marinus]|uniref:RNA polymerase sigma factor n=1 Tax=Membranihabitans marinus TaxID=1227546 RepID=UPI001F15993F|nr:sigma-70 family RNA polymerase sigma factor [Membranihabitans marinus]
MVRKQSLSKNFKNQLQSHIRGEEGAFESFYKDSYNELYIYGLQIEKNEEFLKDYLQNFYLELFVNTDKFIPKGNTLPYILRSFRHFIIKSQKKEQKLQNISFQPSVGESPEIQICREEEIEERSAQTSAILDELTPREREIIYLRYFQELDAKEIASILSIQHQVVRNLAYRAMTKVRKKFNNRDRLNQHLQILVPILILWILLST